MRWVRTANLGKPGYAQSRLCPNEYNYITIAEVALFREPQYPKPYALHFHRRGTPVGFHYFYTLEEAEAWGIAVATLEGRT